jgi:hypothetical protein
MYLNSPHHYYLEVDLQEVYFLRHQLLLVKGFLQRHHRQNLQLYQF